MASKEKKQPEKQDDSFKSEMMHRLKTHPVLFIGTVIILVIVIIAFVFVPALVPNAQLGGDLVFGYYNKVPIKYVRDNYFSQMLQIITQGQQPSTEDPNYIFAVYESWMGAFQETVIRTGVLDEMKNAGYKAPEDVVDREVAELEIFQENGRFSAAKYRAMDNNSRMSLWRQVQENIAVEHYMSDLAGLRTSSKETSFVSAMASPRRNFDVAVFPLSSYPDSEVASFAAANPDLFRATHLSRITVESSEQEARQILDSVKDGTSTFEEAAKNNSRDQYAEKGGDMGIRMAYEFIPEISDEQIREGIINLTQGSLSDLVSVSSGWAFFRAEDAVHPADTGDPVQMENIRNYIMNNVRGQAEDWLLAEARTFSAQAKEKGFNQAVTDGNIDKRNFGPIPVNYGNTAILGSLPDSAMPGLGSAVIDQNFWKAAFSTPLNTLSEPLVIGDDAVIVLFPLEESVLDETQIGNISAYYPIWRNSNTEFAYRAHFLGNEKLDNRFDETFWKLWMPN